MNHSELYNFATHFWWLIFPIAWMMAALVGIALRYNQSQRILDMIQSQTAQGKEPPAALVEMYKAPRFYGRRGWRYDEPYYTHRLWRRFFLFGFLAVAFATMSFWRDAFPGDGPHMHFGWV